MALENDLYKLEKMLGHEPLGIEHPNPDRSNPSIFVKLFDKIRDFFKPKQRRDDYL